MTYIDIERAIAYYLGLDSSMCKFVRLNEKPEIWRHACSQGGVVSIDTPNQFVIDNGCVKFIFCSYCRKVIYFVEGY